MIRRALARERLVFLILLLLAGIQAFGLSRRPEFEYAGSNDPLSRLLGSAKELLGDFAFLKADLYFHHGARRKFDHAHRDHAAEEGAHAEETQASGGANDGILLLYNEVVFDGHYELGRGEEQEILPFLSWAVSLSPHNVQAVLTTAYWLERHFGKPDEAAAVLETGANDNPDAWEIEYELGKTLYKQKNYARAAPHLSEAARKHGPAGEDRILLREIYYYLGESESALSDETDALQAYRKVLDHMVEGEAEPLKEKVLGKIRALEGDAS